MDVKVNKIPQALRELDQWVLWRTVQRDRPTKVPYGINGRPAKANDPKTWASFEAVVERFEKGGFDGIGFEFTKDDPFVGVDLDGCRNSETGELASWAKAFIEGFQTYSEVSPSQNGVKMFCIGKLPFETGRKTELKDAPKTGDKQPAVEVYEHGRYFAVTGLRLGGLPVDPQSCEIPLSALCDVLWPLETRQPVADFHSPQAVVDRARKYLLKCPAAISGQGGHNATFRTACILVLGFQLERSVALALLREWNQLCNPPWSDHELEHKVDDAIKQTGERGYLRNANPREWAKVKVPDYAAPKRELKKLTTIAEAANAYLNNLRAGNSNLLTTGLPNLDQSIGGGFEFGEMVIVAARPSHGKSAVALQCAHHWTANDTPVLFVTEEMSAMALGKRTVLYASETPQEHWHSSLGDVEIDVHEFAQHRSQCYIAENCGTTDNVVAEIERAVNEYGVKCVIVDYAQLLSSRGNNRYEQITNTSIALRKVASEKKILLLVLCQLNREIENRPKFQPKLSDLKETGQLEQDADVIIFLVWPHRIDTKKDPHTYKFYVAKNRNREIASTIVECRFEPSRQRLMHKRADEWGEEEPAESSYQPFKD